MPRPAQLQKAWDADPTIGSRAGRPRKAFPEYGTLEEQERWFRQQFLRLAEAKNEEDRAEKAALLKMAYQTLPGKAPVKVKDDPGAAYREHLARLAEAGEKKLEAERAKRGEKE